MQILTRFRNFSFLFTYLPSILLCMAEKRGENNLRTYNFLAFFTTTTEFCKCARYSR